MAKVAVKRVRRGSTQKFIRVRCIGAEPLMVIMRKLWFKITFLSASVESSWRAGE